MSSTSSDLPSESGPGAQVSPRWAQWRRSIPIADYEARFERLAVRGDETHGEADLIESYRPRSVLDAGCGTGRVAIELARRGIEVVGVDLDDEMLDAARAKAPALRWISADLAAFDLGRAFDVVALPGNVVLFCLPDVRRDVVRGSARHVAAGGRLIVGFSLESGPDAATLAEVDASAAEEGLVLEDRFATWDRLPFEGGDYAVSVYRRSADVAGLLLAPGVRQVIDVDGRLRQRDDVVAAGVDVSPLALAVAPTAQLPDRADAVLALADTLSVVAPALRRLTIHNLVAHLRPSGVLLSELRIDEAAMPVGELDALAAACGLELIDRRTAADGSQIVSLHRRTDRVTIHDIVAGARSTLVRLDPPSLHALIDAGEPLLVLDTRTPNDRERDGSIAGSVATPRTVLEWRCDPASGYSIEQVTGFDQLLVVVCNDGYSSSLAASELQRLGHHRATDLVGGMAAWRAAGLPMVREVDASQA